MTACGGFSGVTFVLFNASVGGLAHLTPQALKEKVDSLMAAGKLFVVDHDMLKVSTESRKSGHNLVTRTVSFTHYFMLKHYDASCRV